MVCGAVHGATNPDCVSVHAADRSSACVTVGSDVCGSVHGAENPDCGSLHGAFSCLFWENERFSDNTALTWTFFTSVSAHVCSCENFGDKHLDHFKRCISVEVRFNQSWSKYLCGFWRRGGFDLDD